jgi:hypothetical protein
MSSYAVACVFDFSEAKQKERILLCLKLVGDGYLKRTGEYYSPTQKMLYEAFLPKIIKISKETRIFITKNEVFTKEELVEKFNVNHIVIHWLKMNDYFYQSSDCRWRKTDKLNELLSDGVEEIPTT